MIRKTIYHWHVLHSRFADALALSASYPKILSPKDLWVAYRLGLYRTVADSSFNVDSWQAGFALAVSFAACGQHDQTKLLLQRLQQKHPITGKWAALADALAPFSPEMAVSIIEQCPAKPALRAALLLRVGRQDEALRVLEQAKPNADPQLHLLMSNALTSASPIEQLGHLNAFLSDHGLPALSLKNAKMPPGPSNLCIAEPVTPFHGPLVSVLMTSYNSRERIDYAINSLLEQSYRNIEIIVVDDASSDHTGEVVQQLAANDARVSFHRLPRNVGTYVAKSIALNMAKGEFVTCHDSDDWSHPLRLEHQVLPLLNDKGLVFTTSQWVRMQDDGIYYARPVHPLPRLNPASPLFRRELVMEKAGGWDAVRTGADSEFLARLRLVFGRKAMKRVVKPLALGAHRPDSLMTAAATGYDAAGMSPTRLDYWEGWGHWHVNAIRAGRKPYMPLDLLAERCFDAPDKIIVPKADIEHCLQAVRIT